MFDLLYSGFRDCGLDHCQELPDKWPLIKEEGFVCICAHED